MAAPQAGGDFGSALAGAPAFGLFAWLLLGRTLRVRTVAILAAVLGNAHNDSGVAIPAVMALVFECALVFVALTPTDEPASRWRDYSPSATPERSVEGSEEESQPGREIPAASSC
jgi:hypothetical protein